MVSFFRRQKKQPRVLVIGLDCAEPTLLFDQFSPDLPNLMALRSRGIWGELNSCIPCITVPAWSSMMSSRDPGVLGVYGFRNRADYSYEKLTTATSLAIKEKRLWDYLSDAGKQSVVISVPQTYPIQPINGYMTSCFLTPSLESPFAHPPTFREEILTHSDSRYMFDVKGFRTDKKDWLLGELFDMTEIRFNVLDHLIADKAWDFFMWVEIGVDRIHHGFWRYHDPLHRLYSPGNPYQNAIRDYYKMVDARVGRLLERVDDDTAILVVSDHGATRMDGGVCLNEWLWKNGWLHFKQDPPDGVITPFEKLEVDWSKTRAWGDGGYYGRLFLNVQGREPQGIVHPDAYEDTRTELEQALNTLVDHETGQIVGATCHRPQQIYQTTNNIAPDFVIYFGNLHYRSIGSLGYGAFTTRENDTGPDDANHGQAGLFIWVDPANPATGRVEGYQLMDVAPTLLNAFGLPIPSVMQGRIIR
jgi:predicted AlkP superfamily phosphohydrolase/phosphomutase